MVTHPSIIHTGRYLNPAVGRFSRDTEVVLFISGNTPTALKKTSPSPGENKKKGTFQDPLMNWRNILSQLYRCSLVLFSELFFIRDNISSLFRLFIHTWSIHNILYTHIAFSIRSLCPYKLLSTNTWYLIINVLEILSPQYLYIKVLLQIFKE